MTDASASAELLRPAAVREAGAYQFERPLHGTRAWFAGFVLWMVGLTVLALALFHGSEQLRDPRALRGVILALLCFYLSLCNSFVPLPTAWIVLLAASPSFALVHDPWANIVLVAALSTLGTVIANLTEYHLLAYLLHFGLGTRIRRTKVYGWAVRWFDRAPFQFLTLIAFIPIPVDAIRWLSILRGYPRGRFALAYCLGRGPRYVIFAACSVMLSLGAWQILAIQVGLVAAALLGRGLWWVVRRSRASGAAERETTLAAALQAPAPDDP